MRLTDKDKEAFKILKVKYNEFRKINKDFLKHNKEISPMIYFILHSKIL